MLEGVGKGGRFGERSVLEYSGCCWSTARCQGSELLWVLTRTGIPSFKWKIELKVLQFRCIVVA